MIDRDDDFANAVHIPGGSRWPLAWSAAAQAYRNETAASGRARLDLSYGRGSRERFDLFMPRAAPCGVFVFVHGGYWLAFDKSDWSHLARGAVERGWAVAIPSYRQCPEVRIGTIAYDIANAIAAAAVLIDGPIVLAGHSAGGQLVARLAATTSPLTSAILHRLHRVTTISGLHDLAPLMATRMNATLRIDAREAARESPAFLQPLDGVTVTAWVGANERPEFIRQTDLLGARWPNTVVIHAAARHHFDVIDPLCDPASDLTGLVIGERPGAGPLIG